MPQLSGRLEIPAVSFSFFDPDRHQYLSRSTAPIGVEIAATPGGVATPSANLGKSIPKDRCVPSAPTASSPRRCHRGRHACDPARRRGLAWPRRPSSRSAARRFPSVRRTKREVATIRRATRSPCQGRCQPGRVGECRRFSYRTFDSVKAKWCLNGLCSDGPLAHLRPPARRCGLRLAVDTTLP